MEDYKFQVDLKGLISLLSDHLYSKENVFLRELLQNGVDAIAARRLWEPGFTDGKILIEYIEEENGQGLVVRDNGIGLTREELHQFLAVIGQSSKRGEEVRDSFIGQFGIGLLSCFLAADEIEVITCSAKDRACHRWLGRCDGTYGVESVEKPRDIGTDIYLTFKKETARRFDRTTVVEGLKAYGFLLPVPILFQYHKQESQINNLPVPWRQDFCTRGDILEFGEFLFQETFLDVVTLQGEGLQGYAYISTRPVPAGERVSHQIYLRSMFLTEDGRDLIPAWASFVHCVVDADQLTPTASREGVQRDEALLRAKKIIETCLLNYLTELSRYDLARMKELAGIHNLAFKAFALESEGVLKLLFPFLLFSSNRGKVTGAQILGASKRRKVYYCVDLDSYRRTAPLLEYSNWLLVNAAYIYEADILRKVLKDNPNLPLCLFEEQFLDELLEQASEEEERVLALFCKEAEEELKEFDCSPALRRLSPPELPSLYLEGSNSFLEKELKTDLEEFAFFHVFEEMEDSAEERTSTLYLNCENSLIRKLSKITRPEVLRATARVLYVQARLAGQYPVAARELNGLSEGLSELLAFGIGGGTNVY